MKASLSPCGHVSPQLLPHSRGRGCQDGHDAGFFLRNVTQPNEGQTPSPEGYAPTAPILRLHLAIKVLINNPFSRSSEKSHHMMGRLQVQPRVSAAGPRQQDLVGPAEAPTGFPEPPSPRQPTYSASRHSCSQPAAGSALPS